MKRKMIMLLDTETCNGIVTKNTKGEDEVDLTNSLVYDIGWQIIDQHRHIYVKRSFVIYDTFVGMKEVMASAYYAEKIPMYEADIKSGKRKLVTLKTVMRIFREDMAKYGANICVAHNMNFDRRALNNTVRYITKSKCRYFFPKDTEFWCTLKMANQTYAKEKGYARWCNRNGYMTKHKTPRPRLTAEIITRYIRGNNSFEESHTGLEDVEIESEILWAIVQKHKKLDRIV